MCDHVPSVPVRFDVPIPEADYSYVKVLWPKGGQRIKVIVTAEAIVGCLTHWIGGRTRPCYTPVTICRGCVEGHARLWKGFVGGVCFYTKVPVIAMLTPHACRPWLPRLRGERGGIRGCVLTAWHENGSRGGKVRIDLTPGTAVGIIPPPLDVEGQLKHMWAVEACRGPIDREDRFEKIPIGGD